MLRCQGLQLANVIRFASRHANLSKGRRWSIKHTRTVERYWNQTAPEYLRRLRDELEGKPFDVQAIKNFAAGLGPGALVCDAGCGPCAHIADLLFDCGLRVIGIDLSQMCIELAEKEKPNLDLRVMDVMTLAFGDGALDGIVAYYLLHYLPLALWPVALREFHRVLRPGGHLLVVNKTGEGEGWIPDPLGGNLQTYWSAGSAEALTSILQANGFVIQECLQRAPLPDEIVADRLYIRALRRAE